MKVTIEFGPEIDAAIQHHLDGGVTVQNYVRAAVRFFGEMLAQEKKGNVVGFGDRPSFSRYNTVASPFTYLDGLDAKVIPIDKLSPAAKE